LDERASYPFENRSRFRVFEYMSYEPPVRRFYQKGLNFLTVMEVREPLRALVKEDFRHCFASEGPRKQSLRRDALIRIGIVIRASLDLMESHEHCSVARRGGVVRYALKLVAREFRLWHHLTRLRATLRFALVRL